MNITITPGKAPFHAGLFFSAVRHLLGEPDHKADMGFDGANIWSYELKDKGRAKKIADAYPAILEWMKCFDLKYPESYCQIAKWGETSGRPEPEVLKIVIIFEPRKPQL